MANLPHMPMRRSLGVLFIGISLICLTVRLAIPWDRFSVQGELVSATIFQFFWICLALGGALVYRKESIISALGFGPTQLRTFSQFNVVLIFLLFSSLVGWLFKEAGQSNSEVISISAQLSLRSDVPLFLISLITVGIFTAFAEEAFFRGFLQRAICEIHGPFLAIVISSILFGLVHGSSFHAGAAVMLGLYLGTTSHLSGSIRISIMCHAANNILAVILTGW